MYTRIDNSDITRRCWRTDHNLARIVNAAREKAHAKHGVNSIESVEASDPKFLAILVEEVGELAHNLTYDSGATEQDIVNELVDILAVASAWLDAYRVQGTCPSTEVWLA